MKLLTEYLERAVSLERLAANEQRSQFKNELLRHTQSSKNFGLGLDTVEVVPQASEHG